MFRCHLNKNDTKTFAGVLENKKPVQIESDELFLYYIKGDGPEFRKSFLLPTLQQIFMRMILCTTV